MLTYLFRRLRQSPHGFAARCEATALPRRTGPLSFWAVPLLRAMPFNIKAKWLTPS